MKKVILTLSSILLLLTSAHSQKLRQLYNLYYSDTLYRGGKAYWYPSGLGFRNDTLFIEEASPITVVCIRRENDSMLTPISLRKYREGKGYKFIINHSELYDIKARKQAPQKITSKKEVPKGETKLSTEDSASKAAGKRG